MKAKKILFATLNWGLGHSSRSIPIIHHYLNEGHEIFLASDGPAGKILQLEFPGLPYFKLPSYQITQDEDSFYWQWTKQIPRIWNAIVSENRVIRKLMHIHHFDVVISDNRYGVRHESAKNYLITHQLTFNLPYPLNIISAKLIRSLVDRFDECWIPDFASRNNLTGELSQGRLKIKKRYLGPVSRFIPEQSPIKYDLGIIISGPEPARSLFQTQLEQIFENTSQRIYWVLGDPGKENDFSMPDCPKFGHASTMDLNMLLNQTDIVISRSGYSSIMDYLVLGKKAILIPTPNQPEQIYLANRQAIRENFFVPVKDLRNMLEGIRQLKNAKFAGMQKFLPQLPAL